MKKRPDRVYLGHTLVAAFSVTLAFLAYTAPTLLEHQAHLRVLDGDAQNVRKVTCRQPGQTVVVQRQGPGLTRVEVTLPDANGGGSTQIYPGTPLADALFGELMPMPALRALGMVDQDHMTRFGLDPALATLTLDTAATTHTILLGQTIYGSGDRYAFVPHQGAYSINATLVSALLQGAQRLQDRRVVTAPRDKVTKWEIARDQDKRTLVPSAGHDGLDNWCDAAAPQQPSAWLTDFVERLFRLNAANQVTLSAKDIKLFTITCHVQPEYGRTPFVVQFYKTTSGIVASLPTYAAPYLLYTDPADALINDVTTLLATHANAHD